jgi:hypothetical protein
MQGISRHIRSFLTDRRGNIIVPAAFALPVLFGVGGLVVEYGNGLVDDARNQRVADLASYAGAIAYSGTKSEERMVAAARHVAMLNGIAPEDVAVALEDSPETSESHAVQVDISTQQDLFLSKLLNSRTELNVHAGAMAEVADSGAGKGTPGCIVALSPTQSGVTLSGGTAINAAECTVSSNNTVTVPCGTFIRTVGLNYNSTAAPSQPCNGITDPKGGAAKITKQETPDPLAGHEAIAAAFGRIGGFSSVASMTVPSAPAALSGLPIEFAWNENTTKSQATALGCSASKSGSTWTFTCPAGKAQVNISSLTIGGGINLDFAVNGPATTTYNITNKVELQWATTRFGKGTFNFADAVITQGTTTFGDGTFNFGKQLTLNGTNTLGSGTFNFTKGITTGGGSNSTFGSGTFRFGQSDNGCNGGARYSLCHLGTTLTFGGPSTFELYAGFYNGGGATLTFGAGTANSFKLGPSSNGNAIDLGGGSKTYMANAGTFQIKGNVNGGGGGSCFVVSAASEHDIDGNFIASGAVLLGSGTYTVNGYFSLGQSGGGSVNCQGQTISVKAVDVSLIISGKNASNSGSCNGYSFCIAAGYSGVQLTAPNSGPLAKLAVAGPRDPARASGATLAEGGSGARISGAFYFPNGPIIMSGGSSILGTENSADACLQLIGSRITLSGGTAIGSECIGGVEADPDDAAGKIVLIR